MLKDFAKKDPDSTRGDEDPREELIKTPTYIPVTDKCGQQELVATEGQHPNPVYCGFSFFF